jgi:hypothetical protein
MEQTVSVGTLMSWVYGGDFPAKAVVITDTKVIVLAESYEGKTDTHLWDIHEGYIPVDVEMDEDEEFNPDPYHGQGLETDPETIKDTSFEDFLLIVKKYQ